MSKLNIKNVFLKKVNHLILKKYKNTVTLELDTFSDDKTIKYEGLSLEMTLNDNVLTLKGNWDLENISDEVQEKECRCDEDKYNCCCFETDIPCDVYDHRFDDFEKFIEEDFEILHDSRVYLTTESLITKLTLKIKEG